jgi:hypothetical protein
MAFNPMKKVCTVHPTALRMQAEPDRRLTCSHNHHDPEKVLRNLSDVPRTFSSGRLG